MEAPRPHIPVANLYHLLSYAWDFDLFGDPAEVRRDDHPGYTELLTHLLVRGCVHLLKRGLHRDYREETEEVRGIRGKLELAQSLATGGLEAGRAVCTRDEFSADGVENRILKSVLLRSAGLRGMDPKLAREARSTAVRMTEVSSVPADLHLFHRVRIHRTNRHYGFLLNICRLLLESAAVHEADDSVEAANLRMQSVLDERLPKLFETFVRNFYRAHLPARGWSRFQPQHIEWVWEAETEGSAAYLPRMETDITLEHPDRKLIIDTKYYRSGGINDRSTFESANLYQLHAYVSQLARRAATGPPRSTAHPHDGAAEGLLLYATVADRDYLHRFSMPPHRMSVATVNLTHPWRAIESRLLDVVEGSGLK